MIHEGGWWYRGTTRAIQHEGQDVTIIEYEITNIAGPGTRWLAHVFHARPAARRMKANFQSTLEALGRQLHCATHMGR
jgi:hypothetical protein